MTGLGIILGAATAVYTGFLLAQAKARDLWASPLSPLHMLVHAVVAGSASLFFLVPEAYASWKPVLLGSMVLNLVLIAIEAYGKHASEDAQLAVSKMLHGRYSKWFYTGFIGGGIVPLCLLLAPIPSEAHYLAAVLSLAGIFLTEFVRIRTPQLVSLI